MWDFSDSEAAPASSWSTLPNRSLLCRPLPMDVGRCSCVIVKERVEAVKGVTMSLYSLCTNEGHGRQDRKLAVARHKRQNGRSKFLVAQNPRGLLSSPDDSFLGTISANLMGSKFQIWDQSRARDSLRTQPKKLLGVVAFVPTVTTLTGSFRIMKINHINGLPKDWEKKGNKAHQLFSRAPHYNYASKHNELDFRERAGKTMPKIQTSVKNFQLTMEEKGKQTLLQFGKIGKSKYVMDYRYPLTGYQAFCICLASIDSKLCCSV
ncbi:tubby-like protein 4 isoform X2 [Asparagus officinalis]|uniref:tubby-like protein 4 isoform X2 n=1 Tax=Asparagus officinalis TaxID=4686 RepID=UPI00098E097B|nr:tubby-like protein 4 isoform X2 [Asparagus officinalis]